MHRNIFVQQSTIVYKSLSFFIIFLHFLIYIYIYTHIYATLVSNEVKCYSQAIPKGFTLFFGQVIISFFFNRSFLLVIRWCVWNSENTYFLGKCLTLKEFCTPLLTKSKNKKEQKKKEKRGGWERDFSVLVCINFFIYFKCPYLPSYCFGYWFFFNVHEFPCFQQHSQAN